MKKYKNLAIISITWAAVLSIYIGVMLIKEYTDIGIVLIVAGTAWLTCFLIANLRDNGNEEEN